MGELERTAPSAPSAIGTYPPPVGSPFLYPGPPPGRTRRRPAASTDGQSGSIGVGFAIPSDQIRKTAEQLIASGRATHPVIGVLIDITYTGKGVRIASAAQNGSAPITKAGPADRAGLRPGEVILTFDGRAVTGPDELVIAVRAQSAGDNVEVAVRAASAARTVRMILQAAT